MILVIDCKSDQMHLCKSFVSQRWDVKWFQCLAIQRIHPHLSFLNCKEFSISHPTHHGACHRRLEQMLSTHDDDKLGWETIRFDGLLAATGGWEIETTGLNNN